MLTFHKGIPLSDVVKVCTDAIERDYAKLVIEVSRRNPKNKIQRTNFQFSDNHMRTIEIQDKLQFNKILGNIGNTKFLRQSQSNCEETFRRHFGTVQWN